MKLFNSAILLATLALANNNVVHAQNRVRGERSLQKGAGGPGGPADLVPKGGKPDIGKDGPMGREEVINGPPDRAGSSNETVPVPPHLVNATDDSESIVAREAPLACLSALMGNEDPTQMFVSNADLTSCVSSVYRPDPDTGMNSHKTSLQEIADCLNALFEC